MLTWNDNCGSHRTASVRDVGRDIGIDVAYLPRYMTSELQVVDLVVNGRLKAHIRTNRANRLYKSFQAFKREKAENENLPMAQTIDAEFNPPKPTQLEGTNDLFLLFGNEFKSQKFKDCTNRTVIKTGTIPIVPEGSYDPTERDIAENRNE